MAEAINTLNAKNEIQAQLDGFNVQLLSTLPSLKNENIFWDFTRAIAYILGWDIDASWLVEALRQERMKAANNPNYNSAQEKSA